MADFNSSLTSTQIETILAGINSTHGVIQHNSDGTFQAASIYPLLIGSSAPTSSTVGSVGQFYLYSSIIYVCTSASLSSYTWVKISSNSNYVPVQTACTLSSTGWTSNKQVAQVSSVTQSSILMCSPSPSSASQFRTCDITVYSQGTGTVTFSCSTTPSSNIDVYVIVFD